LTFHGDERVVELAKRELQRASGAIGTVAEVFSDHPAMRRLVLDAAAPLDLNMRAAIVEPLSMRAAYDAATGPCYRRSARRGDAHTLSYTDR